MVAGGRPADHRTPTAMNRMDQAFRGQFRAGGLKTVKRIR
jgi:hypothetical protein